MCELTVGRAVEISSQGEDLPAEGLFFMAILETYLSRKKQIQSEAILDDDFPLEESSLLLDAREAGYFLSLRSHLTGKFKKTKEGWFYHGYGDDDRKLGPYRGLRSLFDFLGY